MRDRYGTVWVLVLILLAGADGVMAAAQTKKMAPPPSQRAELAAVLDDWHQAAAAADGERYFAHFSEDAVFLGTDAGERWTLEEFREYARPHFDAGRGWTCHPLKRHITFSDDGSVAWVDEQLEHTKYGRLRGTAVLLRQAGRWRIAHYSMTFLVPNAASAGVVEAIREGAPETP